MRHSLYCDIESRSKSLLKERGSFRYCADPSTEPLFLCWAVDAGEIQTWRQGDPVPAPFFAAAANPADWNVVAHNYFFELPSFDLILGPRFGFPIIPLEAWHCTMRLALANAHPAELGLLAQSLNLPYVKDAKAVKALRDVCRPKKNGGGWDEDPAKLELVHQRCMTDVEAARAIWLHPGLRHLDETERHGQILDAKINTRGVGFDRVFVTAARDFATAERNGINTRLYELTDGAISTIDQVQKLRAAINARGGHQMETLGKRAVAAVLAINPDEVTKQLLELRRDGARSSVRKFAKILDFADANDDRLRGTLTMFGASTGRWTAPGPMLHNLKRNELGVPLSVLDAVIRNDRPYIAQFGSPLTVLSNISRGMLVARRGHLLYSADYRMIESRVLAWDAGEEWKLQLHRTYDETGDPRFEPYRQIASQMTGIPIDLIGPNERQKGKFAELAAGFGGGIGAWRRIFDDSRPDAEIERDKIKWRDLHPKIVMFWHRLFRAVRIAVQMGAAVRVNEPPLPEIVCYFETDTLYISLPSGRCLTYPGARLVPGKFEGSVDLAYFDNSKKQWRETRAWYGMIVENVVSAIARDLLAAAIVRFEARGLPVVFHWHDDCVCEIPAGTITDAEFLSILLEPPTWATGLPLAGSVHSGLHYLPASDEPVAKTAPVEIVTDAATAAVAPVLENPIEQALDELIAEPASIDYSPAVYAHSPRTTPRTSSRTWRSTRPRSTRLPSSRSRPDRPRCVVRFTSTSTPRVCSMPTTFIASAAAPAAHGWTGSPRSRG
jgi:DNA polymerase